MKPSAPSNIEIPRLNASVPMSRWARGALSVLLTVAAAACATEVPEEETQAAEGEIIRFPTAVFTNAGTITYGQSLSGLAFAPADQFLALKFNAAAGDRVIATVDASPKKSIVYVARKQGNEFRNVKAGGTGGNAPNTVTHTTDVAGEYFLVFRTVPRSPATFKATLDLTQPSSQTCPNAGVVPTVQDLAAASPAGQPAQRTARGYATIERRNCTFATGCGPVTATTQVALPYFDYKAVKNGAQWTVDRKIVTTNQPKANLDAQGALSGFVDWTGEGVSVPIKGSQGPGCAVITETFLKVAKDSAEYTEYRVVPDVAPGPWRTTPHDPAPALVSAPVIEPISDEEVLSRFPRGSATLAFPQRQTLRFGTGANGGAVRECHPLTSCTATRSSEACFRLSLGRADVWISGAKVRGPDAYSLTTSLGELPIDDGVGSVFGATVRLGETSIQFELPGETEDFGDDVSREWSSSTCTLPFAWPSPP